jgi:molybdenum cofactor biosynthesis enzyme MoaA
MARLLLSRPDPKPAENLRFLRAAVAHQCNLACLYCPKKAGMENHVPTGLRGDRLCTADYIRAQGAIAASGIVNAVAWTGGEPTLRPDLPAIVAAGRRDFTRTEMTTNGLHLPDMFDDLAPNLDLLKVSLDAADPVLAQQITQGKPEDFGRALTAIRLGLQAGLPVGVNVVVMRRTVEQIPAIIALIADLHADVGRGTIYISLLDLYYTPSTRDFWRAEFVAMDTITDRLTELLGPPVEQFRKGCVIRWFDSGGMQIRIKDSHESTFRGDRCTGCPVYCQEGFYGLKLSVEGWVTPCPNGDERSGVHLSADLDDQQMAARVAPLTRELAGTRLVEGSFATFLDRNGLDLTGAPARPLLPLTVVAAGRP